MPPRLLLIDDTAPFLAAAAALLAAEGFEVVGQAAGGVSGIAMAAALRPDVAVVDIGLPDIDGFAVAEALTADIDHSPVVVLVSSRDWTDLAARVTAAGAAGFVHKADLDGAVVRALMASRQHAHPAPGDTP